MAVFPKEFVVKNDALYIHTGNRPYTGLIPGSRNKFFFADTTDQPIEFETDSNGGRVKVWHTA